MSDVTINEILESMTARGNQACGRRGSIGEDILRDPESILCHIHGTRTNVCAYALHGHDHDPLPEVRPNPNHVYPGSRIAKCAPDMHFTPRPQHAGHPRPTIYMIVQAQLRIPLTDSAVRTQLWRFRVMSRTKVV